MKKLCKTLLAGLMTLSMAACGNPSVPNQASANPSSPISGIKEGGTYIVGQGGEPATLNPDATSDDYNYVIMQNIFSRLYKLNNLYQPIPDLATSYDLSADGMTWTFHLHENAK